MWRILAVALSEILLIGCSYNGELVQYNSVSSNSQAPSSWLTPALNQQDIALLQLAFKPAHPLANVNLVFSHDHSWQSLNSEWISDMVKHGEQGDWQLRDIEENDGKSRHQYRLVHGDFSVEYFYFDVVESADGVRIDDIGNHLYFYSQVELMAQLYRRVVFIDAAEQQLNDILTTLTAFNNGSVTTAEVFFVYSAAPQSIRYDRLVRELLLRALMSNSADWMETTELAHIDALLTDDYPLLSLMVCMAHPDSDCVNDFDRLPSELKSDVALITEMGIRTLQTRQAYAAIPYAERVGNAKVDYFPAYWLQLQVGIATQNHTATVTTLENLVQRFELTLDKHLLTQVYPTLGQQFLDSNQFKQWAKRRISSEFN